MSTKKAKSKKTTTDQAVPRPESITTHSDLAGLFVIINMAHRANQYIPRNNAPTYMHQSLGSAHTEATRLAALQPGHTFAVFHCIGLVESKIQAPEVREVTEADIAGPQQEW